MNRSYSKIRHIQESNQRLEKRLLSEISPLLGVSSKDTEAVYKEMSDYYKENPHLVNQVMQIGAAFIPIVGPFVSAGIGLADAAMYAKEGKNGEAGVAAVFSLLPGIGVVVSKIPGVKQLGQKGMQLLATKFLTKAPLNAVEQGVITGINLNKELIKQETNSVVKNMASTAFTRTADAATKKVLKNIANQGIEVGAGEIAMNMVVAKPTYQGAIKGGLPPYRGAVKAGTTGSGLTYRPATIPGVTT
jgi:hypothetical protein